MEVYHSKDESLIYGMKIGRSLQLDSVDLDSLREVIRDNAFDLVRIKVNSKDRDIFQKLDALGIYYNLFSTITHFTKQMEGAEVYDIKGCSFIDYTAEWKEELKRLVNQTLIVPTAVNYNSLFQPAPDHKKEIEAAFLYIHNNSLAGGKYKTFLAKDDETGEIEGYYFITLEPNVSEGILIGVSESARRKGVGRKLAYHQQNLAKAFPCDHTEGDVIIQNKPSMTIYLSERGQMGDVYFHINLYPYLSFSNSSSKGNIASDVSLDESITACRRDAISAIPEGFWLSRMNIALWMNKGKLDGNVFAASHQGRIGSISDIGETIIDTYVIRRGQECVASVYTFFTKI